MSMPDIRGLGVEVSTLRRRTRLPRHSGSMIGEVVQCRLAERNGSIHRFISFLAFACTSTPKYHEDSVIQNCRNREAGIFSALEAVRAM
jgi:hypothetical protein